MIKGTGVIQRKTDALVDASCQGPRDLLEKAGEAATKAGVMCPLVRREKAHS